MKHLSGMAQHALNVLFKALYGMVSIAITVLREVIGMQIHKNVYLALLAKSSTLSKICVYVLLKNLLCLLTEHVLFARLQDTGIKETKHVSPVEKVSSLITKDIFVYAHKEAT